MLIIKIRRPKLSCSKASDLETKKKKKSFNFPRGRAIAVRGLRRPQEIWLLKTQIKRRQKYVILGKSSKDKRGWCFEINCHKKKNEFGLKKLYPKKGVRWTRQLNKNFSRGLNFRRQRTSKSAHTMKHEVIEEDFFFEICDWKFFSGMPQICTPSDGDFENLWFFGKKSTSVIILAIFFGLLRKLSEDISSIISNSKRRRLKKLTKIEEKIWGSVEPPIFENRRKKSSKNL